LELVLLPFIVIPKTVCVIYQSYKTTVDAFVVFVAHFVTLLLVLEGYNQATLLLQPYLGHTPVRYHLILRELTGMPDAE
jgi:hypothetical protein